MEIPFSKDSHNSILADKEIRAAVQRGELISANTYSDTSLEASSYDIRVGGKGIVGGEGKEVILSEGQVLEIPPGGYAAVVSYEKMIFPKTIAGRLGAKRALSYDGLILLTGAIVDPGYEGHLLFGIYNASQKKVAIRHKRKICNIVFERLSVVPDKEVDSEPSLLFGNLPDQFMDKMMNMEVLPWMQISDRVKQIENITKDIIDLKKRYDDVMEPISALTSNVGELTKNIEVINKRTEKISDELEDSSKLVNENARQINQLASMVGKQENGLKDLTIAFKSSNLWNKIIWAVVIAAIFLLLGYFLRGGK